MEEKIKTQPMSLKEKVDLLVSEREVKQKNRKMRLPRKSKVRRSAIKKGWIGIIKIDENGNLSGEKQRIEGSTIRLKDKTYHSIDGSEIGFWNGKHPVLVQPTWKRNPMKIRQGEDKNKTYGDKYVMARMLGDTIKVKAAQAKGLLWIVGIGIAAYVGYMLITGQL